MAPTLPPGRLVFAWARPRRILAGDIIIMRFDGHEHIKRVRFVDDERIFVVGDNADLSTDSREYGWLPRAVIVGRVWPRRGAQ